MDAMPKPTHKHRALKIAIVVSLAVLAVLVALVIVVTLSPREHRQPASSIRHSAAEVMMAVDEYLDPREAQKIFDSGEDPFNLLVGTSLLGEVRNRNNAEKPTAYYDSPKAALAAARETHDEDSFYQSMSEPVFVFEGPPYGGNLTAVAACLATGDTGENWLVFTFFDRQGDRYSNPLDLAYMPANLDTISQYFSYPLPLYASEEEKVAETFFDYLGGDKSLFVANNKVPIYVGCSTDPAVLDLTVLGRTPDETATCEYNGTVYYLWTYRTFDFNRYLIDNGLNLNEFYLPDLVQILEISIPA